MYDSAYYSPGQNNLSMFYSLRSNGNNRTTANIENFATLNTLADQFAIGNEKANYLRDNFRRLRGTDPKAMIMRYKGLYPGMENAINHYVEQSGNRFTAENYRDMGELFYKAITGMAGMKWDTLEELLKLNLAGARDVSRFDSSQDYEDMRELIHEFSRGEEEYSRSISDTPRQNSMFDVSSSDTPPYRPPAWASDSYSSEIDRSQRQSYTRRRFIPTRTLNPDDSNSQSSLEEEKSGAPFSGIKPLENSQKVAVQQIMNMSAVNMRSVPGMEMQEVGSQSSQMNRFRYNYDPLSRSVVYRRDKISGPDQTPDGGFPTPSQDEFNRIGGDGLLDDSQYKYYENYMNNMMLGHSINSVNDLMFSGDDKARYDFDQLQYIHKNTNLEGYQGKERKPYTKEEEEKIRQIVRIKQAGGIPDASVKFTPDDYKNAAAALQDTPFDNQL